MSGAIPPFPNTPSWRAAQLEHRDNFTFSLPQWVFIVVVYFVDSFRKLLDTSSYLFPSPPSLRTDWQLDNQLPGGLARKKVGGTTPSLVKFSSSHYMKALNWCRGFHRIGDEVEALDESSIPGLEAFLSRYHNVLHPNHYHCLGVQHSLCQLYGKAPGFLINDMTEAQLRHKRDLCRQLLKVVDVLEPGYSRLRGEISLSLSLSLSETSKRYSRDQRHGRRKFRYPAKGLITSDFCSEISLQYHLMPPSRAHIV
jgi:hypothetical protein